MRSIQTANWRRWEHTRLLASFIHNSNPYIKEAMKVTDVISLPWDLTKEESYKLRLPSEEERRKMMENWGVNKKKEDHERTE